MNFDSRQVRAVLFDMDGTLADTIPDILATFNRILVRHGLQPLDRPGLVSLFGPTEEGILQRLFPQWAPEKVAAELQQEIKRGDAIEMYSEMPALVDACLKAGLRVGVFTGAGRRYGLTRLERMGVAAKIHGFVAGDDVTRTKPAPDGVLRLCELVDVARESAVYVGDSPLDLRSASDAGVQAIGVEWGVSSREVLLKENPCAVVASRRELADMLGLPLPLAVKPRIAVFDLDGTLIDSAAWLLQAVNRVLAPYLERPWTREDLIATAGAPERTVLGKLVPPLELERVLAAYHSALQDPGSLKIQPGAEAMLRELEANGVRLGVFSGAGTALGQLRLRLVGWSEQFSVTVWGDEAAAKPAPDGLILAAQRAGVSVLDAVYVGDTDKDAAAARAAGMPFVGVAWGDQPGGPRSTTCMGTPLELVRVLLPHSADDAAERSRQRSET
jgi:HAD superfamily hydrolase (TIGR01509 family)